MSIVANSSRTKADGQDGTDETPKKLRRITRACDYCHRRSIRCKFPSDDDDTKCHNCWEFAQPCTFERVAKRRGAKPRTTLSAANTPPNANQETEDINRTQTIPGSSRQWKPTYIAQQAHIVDLVEIYFETIYPIFPLFHRPHFRRSISRGDYMRDRFKYSSTMAVCALVTARIADKAIYNPRWDITRLQQVPSEVFYTAAVRECGNSGSHSHSEFDLLRTCALLAITALQYGKIREMKTHLGKYHTLVAMDGLHDEENWPEDIGIIETEERRRLFWSMYTLDVYSSIIWSGVIRCREQQSNVRYTTEIDDEYFDDSGYRNRPDLSTLAVDRTSWVHGWNFVTELYRVMEHVVTQFRDWKKNKRPLISEVIPDPNLSATVTREAILSMYNTLPQCFKEPQEITYDQNRDRYGYQAANITATVQLLRMALFSGSDASIEDRCEIASQVVGSFMRIPSAYLQALSSPLLYHLAGIGTILGSVFDKQNSMTDHEYYQIRLVLLSLAQLLENHDHGIHVTDSAEKIRSIVTRSDEQMGWKGNPSMVMSSNYGQHVGPPALPSASMRDYSGTLRTNGVPNPAHSLGSTPMSFTVPVTNDIRHAWPHQWGYDMQFQNHQ